MQQKLDEMLDALFETSCWIHTDAYSDCDLFPPHTFTSTAAGISPMRPSMLLIQENMPMTWLSQHEMALSEGESSHTSHNQVHTNV